MKYKIIGIGTLLFDKIYKIKALAQPNQSIPIQGIYFSPGGSGANTIFWLGKYGHKCAFFGNIGSDDFGKKMIESFKDANVDCSYINIIKNERTDFDLTFVDDAENRTFYTYIKLDENLLSNQNFEKYFQILKQSEWFFVSSFGNEEKQIKQATKLAKKYKEIGGKIAFSVGVWHRFGLKALQDLISLSDVLFLNKEEFVSLTNEKNVKKGVAKLRKICKGVIVNTRGKDGVYAIDEKNKEYIMPSHARKVVDTTGCGDAFAAGFFDGFFDGSIEKGIEQGTNLAADVIERYGARNDVGCIDFQSGDFSCKE